jgi:hypothetical protein
MPEILVLCPGREGRRLAEEQLGDLRAEVAYLHTRKELRTLVMESGVKAVVSDLFDGEGRPVTPLLRELNHEAPELRIVLSYKPSPAALDDVLDIATSGVRVAFAARPFSHLGRLLEPLLLSESTRPPSTAESLLLRVIPRVETVPARRCLTLAAVNPVPQLGIDTVARFCDITHRTLYRHLEELGPPKLLLSALAWPQANYLLTGLHWTARQVADYCGLRRPALLIDLLGDYLESGLWKLGLDPSVDGVAAATAERDGGKFRSSAAPHPASSIGNVAGLEERGWKHLRLQQVSEKIAALVRSGKSPLEIVRRLWHRHELDPGHLYRGVVQTVEEMRSQGPIEQVES